MARLTLTGRAQPLNDGEGMALSVAPTFASPLVLSVEAHLVPTRAEPKPKQYRLALSRRDVAMLRATLDHYDRRHPGWDKAHKPPIRDAATTHN